MLPRLSRGLIVAVVALGLTMIGGIVLAQDGGPTATPAASPADAGPTVTPPTAPTAPATVPTVTPTPTPTPTGSVDVPPGTKRANISQNDMVKQAGALLDKMKDGLKRVVHLQELARRGKDVIKLNCVNDKLLQVKQLLNIGESASTDMSEAIARGDEDGRYHQFSRITIAQQQVAGLTSEAENCIGEDVSFLGPTEVTVEKPKEPDDPTVEPIADFPYVDMPPVASPFI